MSSIAERRAAASLEKLIKVEGRTMTRREFIDLARRNGAKLVVAQVRQEKAEDKLRADIERAARRAPIGNPHHPETRAYLEMKDQLRAGVFRTEYRIFFPSGTFYTVTKIEADYFAR